MEKIQINEPKYTGGMLMLASGFRPFFLLTALYAVISVLAWAALFGHGIAFPVAMSPLLWHGHEMVYGFALGAICGFLLTAVPNWTGTPGIAGGRLAVLVGLWLLGRAGLWLVDLVPGWAVALADLPLLPVLAWFIGGQIVGAGNKRNYIFIGLLTVFFAGNLMFHLGTLGIVPGLATPGLYMGLYVVMMMVTLISGRIVPSFTANALRLKGVPHETETDPRVERGVVASVVAAALLDLVAPGTVAGGVVALVAAGLLTMRMLRWRTKQILGDPIVWVLHLGHAWLPIGFALLGIANLTGWISATTAIHALTAGAIGTMVMAVGSRAALGHTGRPLQLPRGMTAAYLLVAMGAAVRVFAPPLLPFVDYGILIGISGIIWALGYGVFAVLYLPILTRPRLDGKPG